MKERTTKRREGRIPVLFIVPSLVRAGAETQLINLANFLPTSRFEKYLLSYLGNIDQIPRIRSKEVTFIHIPRNSKVDLGLIRKVAEIIDRKGIEIVHCTMQHAVLVGWLAKLLSCRKPKLVAAIHTTVNESVKGEISDKLLYRYLLRLCDKVIFVCQTQKDYWLKRFRIPTNKCSVIYNGVDTKFFDPVSSVDSGRRLRKAYDIPDEASVICCIAGFRPEKAHDILINAFDQLAMDTYLLLAGEGETKPSIMKLVEEKKLQHRVTFLGNVADVRPVLAASDVSVLCSTAVETFSIAMLESLSMGVPMVASDIGGLSEAIVPGEMGYLVPVGCAKALSSTIAKILGDPIHLDRMRKNCREIVLSNFSEQSMVKDTELLMARLM